jgi:Tol biopolymer transport system component
MRTRSLVLSIVLALVLAPPALATYPGRNGQIVVAGQGDSASDTLWLGGVRGHGLHPLPSPCPPGPRDPPWDSCAVGAPAWSPDGTRLVFDSDVVAPFGCPWRDVYTVNADGSGLTLLTRHAANPDWSVRGEIVFDRQHEHWEEVEEYESECSPTSTIAVMKPGGQARRVGTGTGAKWAPGGRSIAYFGRRGVVRKRIGVPGPARPLLKGGAYDFNWSPDGRFILYRKQLRLKLMDARTGRSRALAFDAPGIDFSPAWQPLPR